MDKRVKFRYGNSSTVPYKAASVNPIMQCPICGIKNSFEFRSEGLGASRNEINYIVQCSHCEEFFLARYRNIDYLDKQVFIEILPYGNFKNSFPSDISEISNQFVTIYEQAMTAKNQGLNELVGVGLRKAFEYLIYDYVKHILKLEPAKTLEKRIEQIDVRNVNVHATLVRWIGNDNTHVEIKHPEFSIEEMIHSIDIIVYYLYAEYKSSKVAEKITTSQSPQ